jgi:hypothetical protein
MDGWIYGKAVLRIAYSNKKSSTEILVHNKLHIHYRFKYAKNSIDSQMSEKN